MIRVKPRDWTFTAKCDRCGIVVTGIIYRAKTQQDAQQLANNKMYGDYGWDLSVCAVCKEKKDGTDSSKGS